MSSRSPCSVLGSRSRSGGRTSAATRDAPGGTAVARFVLGAGPCPGLRRDRGRGRRCRVRRRGRERGPRPRVGRPAYARRRPCRLPACDGSHPRDDPPPGPDRGPETSRTRLSASSNSATVVYRSFGSTAQALRSTFARVSETPGAASRMSGTPVATAALVPSEADRWIELDRQPAHMNAASVPGAVLLRAHHLHDRGAVRRRLAYEGARGRTACGESMSTTDVVHGSTRGWSPECS